MIESIFKNLNLEGYKCVSCTKNISEYDDGKSVTIAIQYSNGLKTVKVGSSCERDKNYKLNINHPLKALFKEEAEGWEIKKTHRVWPDDISDVIVKDMDMVEYLFEISPSDAKRLYL